MSGLSPLSDKNIDDFFSNNKNYLGTFAKDVIPRKFKTKNGAMIINMNNSNQGGSHWVLLLLNKKDVVYFDSFGVVPSLEVLSFMKSCKRPIYYVDRQLQDLKSTSCGWFCIYFIVECMIKGRDILDVLLQDFSYNPAKNESKLLSFFTKKGSQKNLASSSLKL